MCLEIRAWNYSLLNVFVTLANKSGDFLWQKMLRYKLMRIFAFVYTEQTDIRQIDNDSCCKSKVNITTIIVIKSCQHIPAYLAFKWVFKNKAIKNFHDNAMVNWFWKPFSTFHVEMWRNLHINNLVGGTTYEVIVGALFATAYSTLWSESLWIF